MQIKSLETPATYEAQKRAFENLRDGRTPISPTAEDFKRHFESNRNQRLVSTTLKQG